MEGKQLVVAVVVVVVVVRGLARSLARRPSSRLRLMAGLPRFFS